MKIVEWYRTPYLNKACLYRPYEIFSQAKIPTEAGNKAVQDPTNFLKNLEEYINKVKPEAAYFMPLDGHRATCFIVNVESNDQIPTIAEPLFQGMGADVDLIPAMNFDDLKKGLHKPGDLNFCSIIFLPF